MNKEISKKSFYSFKYDRVFKAVFANEDDKELKLLTALIEECIESKVENLKLLKTELCVRTSNERTKRLDLIAKSKGKKLNIEINTSNKFITTIRNLNYFMAFCSQNAVVGEKYDVESEFIHISLNYGMSMKEPLCYCYYLHDPKNEKYLSEKYKIYIVNIDKISKLWYDKSEEVIRTPLLVMLGIDDEEKIDTYVKKTNNNLVKESVLKLKRLNQDVDFVYGISPEDDDIYMRNTEIYLAEKNGEERGKTEGIEIGKTEGIEIGKAEGIEIGKTEGIEIGIVKTMLKYNATMEEIIKETGLSEEEILKIKESN